MDILAYPYQSDSTSEPEYYGEHWELDSEQEYPREPSEMDSDMESEYSEEHSEEDLNAKNDVPKYWKLRLVRYVDKPYNRNRPSKEQQILEAKRDREQVRQIASKLHVKLPRELRDEVYQYLASDWQTLDFEDGMRGLCTASDDEFATPDYKVFCPSYVGHEVACEAVECYYAANVFEVATKFSIPKWYYGSDAEPLGLPCLKSLLLEDRFGLGVLPYKFIRQLHIKIKVTDICPQLNIWRNDIAAGEAPQKELSDLDRLYNDLEYVLSLVVDKAKLDVRVLITPDNPEWYWQGENMWRDLEPCRGDHYRIRFLNVERGVINVLEAMRKFLYELKYAGASVTVLSYECFGSPIDREMHRVFHLSEEDWEKRKEKEEHRLRWGHYQPHRNFIEQGKLSDGPSHYNDELSKNLPQYRRRWGYEDFKKFMCPPESEDDLRRWVDECLGKPMHRPGYEGDSEEESSEEEGYDSDDGYWDSDIEGEQGGYEATYDDLERWGVT